MFLVALLVLAGTAGCAPEYVDRREVPSPDGKWIVDVVREDQSSNDSEPFLLHLSVRQAGTPEAILPGNIGIYPINGELDVTWQGSTSVDVVFHGYGGDSLVCPVQPLTVQGITFTFRCANDFTQ